MKDVDAHSELADGGLKQLSVGSEFWRHDDRAEWAELTPEMLSQEPDSRFEIA
jgi:hypothetical protein